MKRFSCFLFSFFLGIFLLFTPLSHAVEEYTVGEGDVLNIKVYENDDLSTTVRISANEIIRVPLLGEISVKDLTISQVAAKIEALLADGYLVSPQVNVFMEEYRSKRAIIIGEINNPGQYELRGRNTLLEFISKAGGLTSDAGTLATIKRVAHDKENKISINLDKLIKEGQTSLNLIIMDKDTVYISKAERYYVSGEIKKPDSYKYEPGLTVIKAITTAGGFSKIASRGKVRIIRKKDGDEKVLEQVKMDEPVQPNDIIVDPESFF